jgi:NlpC/P60 family
MIINSEFHKAVDRKMKEPYSWGKNDCAHFVADIYLEVTGVDIAEGVRGTYDNERDGMRKIVELGGWDKILTDRGFTEITNRNYVSRGDLVIVDNALGIWVGRYAVFAGAKHRKLEAIEKVYRHKTL